MSVCFSLFRNSLFRLFRFYTETERFYVSIEPKQTEHQLKQFDKEHILAFFRKLRVLSGFFQFVSKQFCLFQLFWYMFETPKQTEIFFWFSRNKPKQILFRFVSVRTKIYFVCFEDTLMQTNKGNVNALIKL